MKDITYTPMTEVIAAFRSGRMVVICDDADRENEGDLAIAAEHISVEHYLFMMQHGRGLVCTSIDQEIGKRLQLPYQAPQNNSAFQTPFTPSLTIAAAPRGTSSAVDVRVKTVREMISPDADPRDFVSPGSVHPLLAHPAGVLGRDGQTEGSYDLARLAGLTPAALICEILRPDGEMMRGEELQRYAAEWNLPITSVAEIFRHRVHHEVLLREAFQGVRVTRWGECRVHLFHEDVTQKEHLALVFGELSESDPVLIRIHSECLTGDVFESERCDCGPQLEYALKEIAEEGSGVILYLRQEGRGIGLSNKLRAYELQDQGKDTVEANLELGFQADERDYRIAVQMLAALGIGDVRLLTNNPDKVEFLERSGITVSQREEIEVPISEHATSYMQTKRLKLGHFLSSDFSSSE